MSLSRIPPHFCSSDSDGGSCNNLNLGSNFLDFACLSGRATRAAARAAARYFHGRWLFLFLFGKSNGWCNTRSSLSPAGAATAGRRGGGRQDLRLERCRWFFLPLTPEEHHIGGIVCIGINNTTQSFRLILIHFKVVKQWHGWLVL